MLSTYVTLSQGELSAAQDQLQGLMACKDKPYLLDDHTINKIIKLSTSQKETTIFVGIILFIRMLKGTV